MAHLEDRWYKTVRNPSGRTERVKTALFGRGLRYRVRYIGPDGREHKKSFPGWAKRDAEAFFVSVESDKLRGAYIQRRDESLSGSTRRSGYVPGHSMNRPASQRSIASAST